MVESREIKTVRSIYVRKEQKGRGEKHEVKVNNKGGKGWRKKYKGGQILKSDSLGIVPTTFSFKLGIAKPHPTK